MDIEILACLAINGASSRRMVESILKDHDHHVIFDAFKRLEDKRWKRITISHSEFGRGRKQAFFKITKNGLIHLASEAVEPWKFWRAMMGYCFHSNQQITIDKLKEFYKVFIDKYLKYPSEYGYCFDLDLFNKVCMDWLQNRIQNADRITLDQIILETLALNPTLTLKQLIQKIRDFNEDELKRILRYYTLIPHKPVVIDKTYIDNYRSGKIHTIKSWELLLHYAIKVRHNVNGVETYELSLFGVLFVMLILRNHDMSKLKNGLYYKDESFETYYDKMASNYQNNLPLIFGEWILLKRILNIFAAYNFDIILDKDMRDKAMKSLSVISGIMHYNDPEEVSINSGNKDLYESAKSIEQISHRQLGEIQVRGLEESRNFIESLVHEFPDKTIEEARRIVRQKTIAVSQLIDEITILLDPLSYDPESFREEIANYLENEGSINATQAERLSHLYDIDTLEKSFANQLSFRYYLNLNNEHGFQVMRPMNYYSSMLEWRREEEYLSSFRKQTRTTNKKNGEEILSPEEEDQYSLKPYSPRIRLFLILRSNARIRAWFLSWIENLENYQKNALNRTHDFYEEIKKKEPMA